MSNTMCSFLLADAKLRFAYQYKSIKKKKMPRTKSEKNKYCFVSTMVKNVELIFTETTFIIVYQLLVVNEGYINNQGVLYRSDPEKYQSWIWPGNAACCWRCTAAFKQQTK